MTGRRTVLLAAALLHPAALPAQAPDTAGIILERMPIGETLVYDARLGFLNIGGAALQVMGIDTIRGVPSLHINFLIQGGTTFYRLNDRMDSWIGLHDFASRRFIQDFDEGGKRRYARYEIFPDSGFYRSLQTDSAIPTSEGPLDDAAFFYFVRSVPLEPGRRYEFNRYFRPDRNPVILEVLGRDTIDVPAGRFATLVIRPTIKGGGVLAEASEPRMWLSDDERRIMVQLKSKFSFATITFRLRKVEQRPGSKPAQP